jgi:D-alanyl-D-alanine dipeptidase
MANPRADDDRRRTFWAEQMEAAFRFMEEVAAWPVEECGEPLTSLREAAEEAHVETHFSETKLGGRFERVFRLRRGLIPDFVAVARAMNDRGWALKVEDGYRDRTMQRWLGEAPGVFDVILRRVVWELGGRPPTPDFMHRRLTALVATRPRIGTHMSGSALDISVLRRDDGAEVFRGGPYLEMSDLTPLESPFLDAQARRNRRDITDLMRRHGFMAYPYEFWHYSKGDAYAEMLARSGRPGRYAAVDADLATGRVTAIADPLTPLHRLDEVRANIEAALRRLGT